MSIKLDYMRELALAHTKHFGMASTEEILKRAGVDLTDNVADADPAIGELEGNLRDGSGPFEAVAQCRARTGYEPAAEAAGDGDRGSIARFVASGNRKDAPKHPTSSEIEATASRMSGMGAAFNDRNNGEAEEVPTSLDQIRDKAWSKWNNPKKRAEAE